MQLFRTIFRVRPTKDHPRFYDWEFGFLSIWLFANSDDGATERAARIVEELPYELVGESCKCSACKVTADKKIILVGADPLTNATAEIVEVFRNSASLVLRDGFSMFLEAAETGAAEPEDFEND